MLYTQSKTHYTCLCQPGYKGSRCDEEIKFDPCVTLSCLNGGHCHTQFGLPMCMCKGDWFGKICQIPKPKSK